VTRSPVASSSRPLGPRRKSTSSPESPVTNHHLTIAALVPVVAAIAVYLPALRNGFVWDDPLVLQQLRAIQSPTDLFVLPPAIPRYYFRPLIFITYWFDRTFAGEVPYWFHASVVGWHALNTFLVFLLARRLFAADWLIASGGALLFAAYPAHVESVAWMAGRSDVVVCTFVLLTVLLGMQRGQQWSAWAAGGSLLLALLSKELAVAVLLLVPLLDFMSTGRLYWLRYLPLAIAAALYFVLRATALGVVVGGLPTGASTLQVVVDLLCAIGFYVTRALVPIGLCAYIPDVPSSLGYLLIGAIAPLAAVALIAWAWYRGWWQPAFLAAWFLIALAPSLMVIVRRSASAVLADRYLYVPSVASCLLLAWALVRLAQSRRLNIKWPAVAIAVVSLIWAAQALPYEHVWTDNLAFWSDVAAKGPSDALPYRELATALIDRGRLDDAERALQHAIVAKAGPEGRAMTYSNLGNLYRRQGRYDDALQAFQAGLKIGAHPILYHNLGMTLMVKIEQEQRAGDQAGVLRDITQARDAFQEALRIGTAPNAPPAFRQEWDAAKTHTLLGQVLFSMGDRAGAKEQLDAALRLEPNGPVADLTRQYLKQMGL
jgi:tetratricopeptide (TPR) repeat protein